MKALFRYDLYTKGLLLGLLLVTLMLVTTIYSLSFIDNAFIRKFDDIWLVEDAAFGGNFSMMVFGPMVLACISAGMSNREGPLGWRGTSLAYPFSTRQIVTERVILGSGMMISFALYVSLLNGIVMSLLGTFRPEYAIALFFKVCMVGLPPAVIMTLLCKKCGMSKSLTWLIGINIIMFSLMLIFAAVTNGYFTNDLYHFYSMFFLDIRGVIVGGSGAIVFYIIAMILFIRSDHYEKKQKER